MTGTNVIKFRSVAGRINYCNPPAYSRKPNDAANWLWSKYLAVIAETRVLDATISEAMGRLPEWARTGPAYLAEDGTLKGQVSCWPQDLSIGPRAGYLVPVRHAPFTIKDIFNKVVAADPKRRNDARAQYRARMVAFVSRVRHQRRLRARLGVNLDDLERQQAVNNTAKIILVRRLKDLPVCANSVAALCLIQSPEKDDGHMLSYLEAKVTGAIGKAVRNWMHKDAGEQLPWVA